MSTINVSSHCSPFRLILKLFWAFDVVNAYGASTCDYIDILVRVSMPWRRSVRFDAKEPDSTVLVLEQQPSANRTIRCVSIRQAARGLLSRLNSVEPLLYFP
jgi:hypothetical protein